MPFTDIVIAVHGIGSQSRFSAVRSVATQVVGSRTLSATGRVRPVAPQPLGYSHRDVKSATSDPARPGAMQVWKLADPEIGASLHEPGVAWQNNLRGDDVFSRLTIPGAHP